MTDSPSPWKGHSRSPQHWLQKSRGPEGGITLHDWSQSVFWWKAARPLFHRCGFGTNESVRQKQTPLCSVMYVTDVCCDWTPLLQMGWTWPHTGFVNDTSPQSLGTQVLYEHGKLFTAVTVVHRVTKPTRRVSLLSLCLLLIWKITTCVHLANQSTCQTMSLNKQWNQQICSPDTLSLRLVSAWGRHNNYINDFRQCVVPPVIAFTFILETLKWLQLFRAVQCTVVLPFVIHIYFPFFSTIFLC